MVGTRNRRSPAAKKALFTDGKRKAHSNQAAANLKRQQMVSEGLKTEKRRTSPWKLNKGSKERKSGQTTRVLFQEEDNFVVLEVNGVEQEFPMEDTEVARNNNVTIFQTCPSSGKTSGVGKAGSQEPTPKRQKLTRADKFRKMVLIALAESDLDRSTWNEEGEVSESSDNESMGSDSSSVKIRSRTEEEIAQEKAREEEEMEKFLNQTIDKTFEKLKSFMTQSGVVFAPADNVNSNKGKGLGKGKSNHQWGNRETEKGAPIIQSSLGTTIYDAAVEPEVAQPNQNQALDTALLETNAGKNRLSTSSEKISDSSGELGATINNFENLDIFIEETRCQMEAQPQRLPWGQDRDRFYQEPPQAGNHQG